MAVTATKDLHSPNNEASNPNIDYLACDIGVSSAEVDLNKDWLPIEEETNATSQLHAAKSTSVSFTESGNSEM